MSESPLPSTDHQVPWVFEGGACERWPNWVSIRIGGHSISGHVGQANGRMIAAARDLFAILNDLHAEFDQQTYAEMSRLDNDPLDEHEFSVNLTAKQLRAINAAILKAEGKL